MTTLILLVIAFYLFGGAFRSMLRLSFALLKFFFTIGLCVLLPMFVIGSLIMGLAAHSWPLLLILGLICLGGRKKVTA